LEIDLDDSQMLALASRLSSAGPKVGGIVGPPGAGKTATLAQEISEAVTARGERVLMCAGQNATVDQTLLIVEAILKERGLPYNVIKRTGNISKSSEDIVGRFATHKRDELSRARVVFTTFHSSYVATGEPVLSRGDFDRLAFDETGQATPEQAWIPLELLDSDPTSKVTVYGDDRQLLPFTPDYVKEKGVLRYLRENRAPNVTQLDTSYRLPDGGVDMTSHIWYNGLLDSPSEVRARRLKLTTTSSGRYREVVDPENTLVYVGVNSREADSGLSHDNPGQSRITAEIVSDLIACGVGSRRILVMAPYRPHVNSLNLALNGTGVEASTVHRRLGAENDVVIFSTTRSNANMAWGIAAQPELWNVATSRERMKLIIVGDSGTTFSEGSRVTKLVYDFVEKHGRTVHVSI